MDTLESLFECESALVFGLGGSGDIVGSIPTARLLEQHGLDVILGGIAWEPVPQDPRPGPRSFAEIDGLQGISETVGFATGETRTSDGIPFTESAVARHYDTKTVLVDISAGVDAVCRGIDAAADRLGLDLVVGVDAGGDVIAEGTEPGVRSPITDGIGLVALDELSTDACLGVFGYGSDGELTLDELESRIEVIARDDGVLGAWGLTPRVRRDLEGLLQDVETEASRVPVEAARGDFGERTIRDGRVTVRLTPASPVTFYFDPGAVAARSRIADAVRETAGIDEATDALRELGLHTEFDSERERLEAAGSGGES